MVLLTAQLFEGGLKTHYLNEFAPLTPDKLGPLICKRINHLPCLHVPACNNLTPRCYKHTMSHIWRHSVSILCHLL